MQKKVINALTYALVLLCVIFLLVFVKAGVDGKFNSKETFQEYIQGFGLFAPVILTLFQAIQVVLPVLPGFLGCVAGAVMFGPFVGFLCNYIGISVGSIMAFALAKKFGTGLVENLFPCERYKKWADRAARSKSFAGFIFIATLLPLFPDDYLCYLSGLTKMSYRKFIWIIILGKPWCILAYSLGFSLL